MWVWVWVCVHTHARASIQVCVRLHTSSAKASEAGKKVIKTTKFEMMVTHPKQQMSSNLGTPDMMPTPMARAVTRVSRVREGPMRARAWPMFSCTSACRSGGGNGVGGHWGGGDTAVVRCTPEMTEMCDTGTHHMVVNMTQTHMTG